MMERARNGRSIVGWLAALALVVVIGGCGSSAPKGLPDADLIEAVKTDKTFFGNTSLGTGFGELIDQISKQWGGADWSAEEPKSWDIMYDKRDEYKVVKVYWAQLEAPHEIYVRFLVGREDAEFGFLGHIEADKVRIEPEESEEWLVALSKGEPLPATRGARTGGGGSPEDRFASIKEGMTERDLVNLMGSEGRVITEGGGAKTLQWGSIESGELIVVILRGGKVIGKSRA